MPHESGFECRRLVSGKVSEYGTACSGPGHWCQSGRSYAIRVLRHSPASAAKPVHARATSRDESPRWVGHALTCRLITVCNRVRNCRYSVDYLLTSDFAGSLWPSIDEGCLIFIVERLMRFLTSLNQDVEIVIRNIPGSRRPGRVYVTAD